MAAYSNGKTAAGTVNNLAYYYMVMILLIELLVFKELKMAYFL